MRLTVKYLQEKLEMAEQDRKRYYDLWQDLKQKEDRRMYESEISNDVRVKCLENENYNLTRIIRVLAKDETLALEITSRDEYRMS
jgi:hypothetical protein